ncbi:MAG TPA: GatB/YqeY domain-containing protein [Polyangiaceae bacterium]|nr:GatB/YqeY domain-containing protein [Polyangiaceae bacterium]
MLIDQIKARMFQAIKAGAHVEKEILRVAVGEITTDAARAGRQGNDEEAMAILRKLLKSNEETLAATTDAEKRAVLTQEMEVLATYLPKSLSVDEIVQALAPVAVPIKAAGNDGQATGIAMKQLKSAGLTVNGKDVGLAIKELRKPQ